MTTLIPKFDLMNGGSTPTGAVNRPINEKLAEVVSVKDFGAVGDGTTDDSVAFANAVATGKSIFVPKGTYKCGFSLATGQRIYGEGARGETTLTPTGNNATVIIISATSVAKQHCTIENLGILNPNSFTGCTGIWFQGTNVSTINDNHFVENVYVSGVQLGVYVTGRLILSTFINVEITTCSTALYVNTDATTAAFNANCFITCRFVNSIQNGFYFTGWNLSNTFLNCDFESNNTANANSYGGVYITGKTEELSFLGCYWESNGSSVAIDTGTIGNNSYGLYITGTDAYNVLIQNCYMVTSGIMIHMDVSSGVIGGLVTGCRFAPLTNGWDIYQNSQLGGAYQPFVIDGNNYFSGKMEITETGAAETPACIRQLTGLRYITGTPSGVNNIDLRRTQNVFCQTSGTITFNNTNTLYFVAGEKFAVVNNGSGSTVIDATIMASGSSVTLTSGQTATFIVANSIGSKKFIRLS